MSRRRRGVALLLALVTLSAVGVMTLTALSIARSERMTGLSSLARVQARGAAEAALADALQGWPNGSTPVVPGDSIVLSSVALPGPAAGRAVLVAMGGPVFAIRASGIRRSQQGDELGANRIELLVILDAPDSLGMTHPRRYPRGRRSLP